ncbi:MAG: hypothetical protein Ct9H300mP19_06100 [Dehalococcoidia bacterium]|nr:MAG: hypothetical protein Ct9H300mP19_06100 [Dehalococcoidia bacterium]
MVLPRWLIVEDLDGGHLTRSIGCDSEVSCQGVCISQIVGQGMEGDVEQDIDDMDAELTAAKIRQRSEFWSG